MALAAMNIDQESLPAWKLQFDADGFLKIGSLLSSAELSATENELERYVREIAPSLPLTDIVWEKQIMPDGSRRVRNLWRMEHYSPYFEELAHAPELLRLASELVNGEAVASAVELFAKPARVGSVVPHHQDNAYFTLVPPDCFTCWIALDASTQENGCIYYARGSHREPVLPHKASGVAGNSMMADEIPRKLDEVPGILARGDAMLHHCLTLHRSEPNRSEHPRRGLLVVYRGAQCRTDPEAARVYSAAREAMEKSLV